MTFERAAELIEKLPDVVDRADLFEHFGYILFPNLILLNMKNKKPLVGQW